jgi:hypothetical protein
MTKPAQSVEFREPEWLAGMETLLEVLNEGVVIADDQNGQALQHFFDDILRAINKVFHPSLFLDEEQGACLVPSILYARNAREADAFTRVTI